MVIPRAMLARSPLTRPLLARLGRSAALCLALGVATAACSSQKQASSAPIGQTRADGALAREIHAPESPLPVAEVAEEQALSRQELNALAAAEEEARQAEWARAALAEVPSPSNDLGVVVVVQQRASDLPWLLAIQNRGEHPVSLVALPELLSFEVIPKERAEAAGAEPAPSQRRGALTPPPEIWCGAAPKEASQDAKVTLLPSELLVYPFDPRSYCDAPDVLLDGATIKARYGFPIETKKVWRKGKLTEEVLPPKPPLAFELQPADAATLAGPPAASAASGGSAPSSVGSSAGVSSTATPAAVTALKHVEAAAFVLDETYPLERIAPLGRIQPAGTGEDAALAQSPTGLPTAAPGDPARAGLIPAAEPAPIRPPPPPPLTLTIRPMGATSNPGTSTVTVTARNTSGRSMRLFLRRELISYQVTGPKGPTTCRMTSSARAPAPAAYSSLGAGSALSLTTRLAEACPKGTFDSPGSYTVFARIDAQNDGREHGFVAYTGTAITQQPAALTVRGTGAQAKPVMRVTSGR